MEGYAMYALPCKEGVTLTVKFDARGDDMTLAECGAAAHAALVDYLTKAVVTFRFNKILPPIPPLVSGVEEMIEDPPKQKEEAK